MYGASTTSKIKESKKNLSVMKKAKKKANRKLGKIAADIKAASVEIANLDKKLERLSIKKEKTDEKYQQLKLEFVDSEKALAETDNEIKGKNKLFTNLLSDQFSVIFAMKQFNTPTQKSIISYEVYQAYKKYNQKELHALDKSIRKLKRIKDDKKYRRNRAKNAIAKYVAMRKKYIKEKERQKKLIAKLNDDEEKYQAKLQELADKQGSLRSTLAKLNILHMKEVVLAKRRAKARREAMRQERERLQRVRREKALARKKAREAKAAIRLAKTEEERKAAQKRAKKAEKLAMRMQKDVKETSDRVKKINSSYHKGNTYSYKGAKTISPIPGAKVVKKFGTYVDPIYKIKIFNESITLRAPRANAKVQNVLNGKVVFSGKSSMLGKVVVVAHSGRMHTVYAGLSKIAPNITVGRKIKKGYIIGKVGRKLLFQATKNSKHINPVKLIRI